MYIGPMTFNALKVSKINLKSNREPVEQGKHEGDVSSVIKPLIPRPSKSGSSALYQFYLLTVWKKESQLMILII